MSKQSLKLAYPGFEKIPRYWDNEQKSQVARVDPGEFYLTCQDEYVYTRLGSCVAACIWDPVMGIGGLNHFLLPEKTLHEDWHQLTSYSCRYGNWAMEQLINGILSVGGLKSRLQAKIFGGASLARSSVLNVGQSNIDFVREYLELEGIPVMSEDLGGPWPRKVMFHPQSGRVKLKRLEMTGMAQIEQEESAYLKDVTRGASKPEPDSIELF